MNQIVVNWSCIPKRFLHMYQGNWKTYGTKVWVLTTCFLSKHRDVYNWSRCCCKPTNRHCCRIAIWLCHHSFLLLHRVRACRHLNRTGSGVHRILLTLWSHPNGLYSRQYARQSDVFYYGHSSHNWPLKVSRSHTVDCRMLHDEEPCLHPYPVLPKYWKKLLKFGKLIEKQKRLYRRSDLDL